jgi:hypothetical protein
MVKQNGGTVKLIVLTSMLIGGIVQGTYFGSALVDLGNTNAKGKPFHAMFEQLSFRKQPPATTPTKTIAGEIFRDSEGRYRQELSIEVGPTKLIRLAYIKESIAKVAYVLDLSNRKLIQEEPLIDDQDNGAASPLSGRGAADEKNNIEGFSCRVINIQGADGVSTELWFSEELEMVLFERRRSGTEERVTRLYNIVRAEPDKTLFAVPAEFKRAK